MTTATAPGARPLWRQVAVPTEHGGWGLTAEPVVLGMAVAPSVAGLCLGVATVLAFLVRTPLRVALVDRHRQRDGARSALARRVLGVEIGLIVVLLAVAANTAAATFWWPVVAAAPLAIIELWFDMRSRSRRLVPELAGAVAISGAAAAIVLAGGHTAGEAAAAWLLLAARTITSIAHVRADIARLHHRVVSTQTLVIADAVALAVAITAAAIEPAATAGAIAVGVVVAVGWATSRSTAPAKVIGIRQSALGAGVVLATAIGFHLS